MLELLLQPVNLALGSLMLLLLYVWFGSRPRGIPPGPPFALPILGHLHLLTGDFRVTYEKWRQQYGDIFSLYAGNYLVVVLNGTQTIRNALVKHAALTSGRPDLFVFNVLDEGQGIFGNSGASWKEQRTTALEVLCEMGMGKNVLAEKIQEEISHFFKVIEGHKGKPMKLQRLIQESISNNICSIVFGQRFEYDDTVFQEMLKISDEFFEYSKASAFVNFCPWLLRLPGDPIRGRHLWSRMRHLEDVFLKPQIKAHLQNYCEDNRDDFIHCYIHRMRTHQAEGKDTTLSEPNLLKTSLDLFIGGSDTTSTVLGWTLLYFLHHPEVQDKCFKELCDVIGTNRLPAMHDKVDMHYLEAVVAETLRHSVIAPGVFHVTSDDATLHDYATKKDYVIPRGALVYPNQHSTTHDPEVWGDPENFRPERFIGPDGKVARSAEFIQFGVGRRACPGEPMARMELFLYLTNLLQRFRFLPADPEALPSLQGIVGLSCAPRLYEIRAVPRE